MVDPRGPVGVWNSARRLRFLSNTGGGPKRRRPTAADYGAAGTGESPRRALDARPNWTQSGTRRQVSAGGGGTGIVVRIYEELGSNQGGRGKPHFESTTSRQPSQCDDAVGPASSSASPAAAREEETTWGRWLSGNRASSLSSRLPIRKRFFSTTAGEMCYHRTIR
jgi:hypothetical protein